MQQLCACDTHMLDPKDTAFVSGFRPCCSATCYWKAEAKRIERRMEERRQERALRLAPYADEVTRIVSDGGHYAVIG